MLDPTVLQVTPHKHYRKDDLALPVAGTVSKKPRAIEQGASKRPVAMVDKFCRPKLLFLSSSSLSHYLICELALCSLK